MSKDKKTSIAASQIFTLEAIKILSKKGYDLTTLKFEIKKFDSQDY